MWSNKLLRSTSLSASNRCLFSPTIRTTRYFFHTTRCQSKATPSEPGTDGTRRCGLLAIKKGMTAMWDPWGVHVPLTLLQVADAYVTQVKTQAKEGYDAVQVGAVKCNPRHLRTLRWTRTDVPALKHFREFKVTPDALLPQGHVLTSAHFDVGKCVDVQARTIGKGFQGVMKRWGFKGQPASHGVSKKHRSPGSISQSQDPSRVFKGKKMAGRMGNKIRSTLSLKIMKIDHTSNTIFVKGPVPGHDGTLVRIRDAVKKYGQVSGPIPTHFEGKTGIEVIQAEGKDPYLVSNEP